MPSKVETFGLVYIEALTQGLPILYSQGEGIDGSIPESCGVRCNPNVYGSIVVGMRQLMADYSRFRINQEELLECFDWNKIAERYVNEVYSS